LLIDVESDGKGYAAITGRDLIVGRFGDQARSQR
jgi:hypothetical protein